MPWFKIVSFIRFYFLAFVTALFFLFFTLLTFYEVYERVEERNTRLFQYRVQTVTNSIEKRMLDYIQILKGVQAMYQVSDSVGRDEWKEYVKRLEVDVNYPGILGIGYSVILPEDSIPEFEKLVREKEYPQFRVWPEGQRGIYTSILFLEPLNERNKRAIGFDMFSDSVRREAMVKARDTGNPALSGMVKLVQETSTGVQNGFLLYLPLYKDPHQILLTEAAKRKNITGFVYSPFRVNDLMEGVFGSRFQDIGIEIYDGTVANTETLLYDKDTIISIENPQSVLRSLSSLEIAGHHWLVYIEAHQGFGSEVNFPWFILGGGAVISILLFIIMYSVANIRRSTYMTRLITDNATPALLIVDNNGYCTFMNPAAEFITGYSFEESGNKSFHKLIHHSHPDGSLYLPEECPISNALLSNTSLYNHEDVFFRKNGNSFYGSINTQPILENGTVVAHLIEMRDISMEKQAELSLKETNRNLTALNKIGRSLSAELDLKRLIQLVTDSCTELCGAETGAFFYNYADSNGNEYKLYALSGPESENLNDFPLAGKEKIFDSTFKGNLIIRSEDITRDPVFKNIKPDPSTTERKYHIKSYLAVPVISRSGNVIGALVFGHSKPNSFSINSENVIKGIAAQAAIAIDNSRLFEDLNSKNTELIRINSDLDNFVYTASHDLKAPMLNIEGLVYALQKAIVTGNSERINQIIEMIQLSVQRFKETIQALTEVSKVNKNLDEEVEKVNLAELLEEIKLSINDMIESTGAEIEENLACSQVHFSKINMKSILLNLLTNSIKYRRPSVNPLVKITCSRQEGNILIKVSDNGLGIPENQLSKVFVMFKRYHSHVEGTGVGLYLVKRIIDNYGGTLQVKSEVDKGTTFTILLPDLSE